MGVCWIVVVDMSEEKFEIVKEFGVIYGVFVIEEKFWCVVKEVFGG